MCIKEELDKELDRLESEGIITLITNAKWAAPTVPVEKQDNSIRVCGDYRLTADKAARLDTYPIPRLPNVISSLAGGCHLLNFIQVKHTLNWSQMRTGMSIQ